MIVWPWPQKSDLILGRSGIASRRNYAQEIGFDDFLFGSRGRQNDTQYVRFKDLALNTGEMIPVRIYFRSFLASAQEVHEMIARSLNLETFWHWIQKSTDESQEIRFTLLLGACLWRLRQLRIFCVLAFVSHIIFITCAMLVLGNPEMYDTSNACFRKPCNLHCFCFACCREPRSREPCKSLTSAMPASGNLVIYLCRLCACHRKQCNLR